MKLKLLAAIVLLGANPAWAAAPGLPPNPTRDPNTPGYVKATVLPDSTNPPADAEGNYIIGPHYVPAPELTANPDVPKGDVYRFTMNSTDSKIYPGIDRDPGTYGVIDPNNRYSMLVPTSHPAPYTRQVLVYVPKQYVPGTAAPFIVGADGPDGSLPTVLDNLIAEHKIPAIIAISIAHGGRGSSDPKGSSDAQGSERGLEYDTMSGLYAE